MFFARKTFVAAVAAGALVVGNGPARAAQTTPSENPLTNPSAVLPITPGSLGLTAKGFNQANFAAVWSAAPTGFTPKLTDVRLFTKGTLLGSFTVENYNPSATVTVNNPAVTFNEKSNGMFSSSLTTVNTTGVVPVATVTSIPSEVVGPQPAAGLPGSPPTSPSCPAGWVAGPSFGSGAFSFQQWNCSSTTTTPGQATFQINPSTPTAANWSLIGSGNTNGVASSFWSANTVSIQSFITLTFPSFTPSAQTATFTLNGSGVDNYILYNYDYVANGVPGPLPLAGAGLAFGFSRRLRRRIKSSSTIAS